jgi:hypothetical protein
MQSELNKSLINKYGVTNNERLGGFMDSPFPTFPLTGRYSQDPFLEGMLSNFLAIA